MLNMFVYGTLRRGEANNVQDVSARHGLAAPRFLGTATICGRLHDFGRFPGLVVSSTGIPVLGEVYEIADELRAILDEIERAYPEDDTLFDSQAVELEVGGRRLSCSFYPVAAASAFTMPEIRSGGWVDHHRYRISQD